MFENYDSQGRRIRRDPDDPDATWSDRHRRLAGLFGIFVLVSGVALLLGAFWAFDAIPLWYATTVYPQMGRVPAVAVALAAFAGLLFAYYRTVKRESDHDHKRRRTWFSRFQLEGMILFAVLCGAIGMLGLSWGWSAMAALAGLFLTTKRRMDAESSGPPHPGGGDLP